MKREEIFIEAEKNNIHLTDSQFRRYVQNGLLSSERSSEGKGKGVKACYPLNSLDVILEITNLKSNGIYDKDLIQFLFSKGYLVDIKKLKLSLVDYVEDMIVNFNHLLEVIEDNSKKEWVVGEVAEKNLPVLNSGRPSKKELERKMKLRRQEQEKLFTVLNVINEIFSNGQLDEETSKIFLDQLGYTSPGSITNKDSTQEWMDVSNWGYQINRITKEELSEVQRVFKFIGWYIEYFKENQVNSVFIDKFITPFILMFKNAGLGNPLVDPNLLKFLIILLLVNRLLVKFLNQLLSLSENIGDKETLHMALPIVLQSLDEELKGGEIKYE
ncbi:hypothetical protein [Bacillus suaedaesalsae]|uniref:HTH merR-type domain-containing protein n=1 Tax=Bacillus suaedaesalsae TaxID=2810349 RepID=A0ABS2DFN8_9BACI|nr:hypothetical protein [Bacillus suaedaesalsae]MBM6617284.1 hypothetical protein [Bacillus suaedaesalsae]